MNSYKYLNIPEGSVVKITDESGIIIWRHGHSFLMDWVVDKAATCLDDGARHRNCATCDYIHNEIIKALGHKYVEYVVIDHTCTTPAIQKYKCIRCDEDKPFESSDIIRPAPGHKWGDPYYSSEFSSEYGHKCTVCGELEELDYVECQHPVDARSEVITTPATCTTVGIKTCSCNVCGSSWSEEIAALEHSYGSWQVVSAATCESAGMEKRTCTICNTAYETQEIPIKEHTEEDIPPVAATCTTPGSTKGTKCTVCGQILVEPEYIAPLDHDMPIVGVVTYPTCTEGGYTTWACKRGCGYSETGNYTDPTGHSWVEVEDAQCPNCGEMMYSQRCTVCGTTEPAKCPNEDNH